MLLLRHLRLAAGDSSGLEVGLGFLAGGRQIRGDGGGAEVRAQGADGLAQGHGIGAGKVGSELIEGDAQIVRDVLHEEKLAGILESGGRR